jgi:NitT/TauT family transport system substrate-binding protein
MNRKELISTIAGAAAAGAPALVRSQSPMTVRIGTHALDGGMQPYYGEYLNSFKDAGLDVQVSMLNNTAEFAAAISGGSVDVAFGNVIPLAEAHLRGLEFLFLAAAVVYNGRAITNAVMTGATSRFKTAADLNGQIIGVNGLRDIGQYELQSWIDKNGGDATSVKMLELPFPQLVPAMNRGTIAAAIMVEPYITLGLRQARIIGNASEAIGKHFMVTGWFASAMWLRANASTASVMRRVFNQIGKWANTNPNITQTLLPKYTPLSAELAAKITRSEYGDALNAGLVQPVIDVAVKYGNMPRVKAQDLIWQG